MKELVQASAGEASPSHPTPGAGAGVQGVLQVSQDGTHASFVATGVLTAKPSSVGDSAEQGADNLYVYDATSGETKFVARLCSGSEESGTLADPACPASLEGGNQGANDSSLWKSGYNSQFTPDGGYLLFSSYGRLTPDDTDNVTDDLPLRFLHRPAHPRLDRPPRQRRQRQRRRLPGRNSGRGKVRCGR